MSYSLRFLTYVKRIKCLLIFSLLLFACSTPEANHVEPHPIVEKHSLSLNASEGGAVSPTDGIYDLGSSVTITAIPDNEYVFTGWSNGSTENPITITLNADINLIASFSKRIYSLNINIISQGTVSETIIQSGGKATDYTSGTVIQLHANPDNGWRFVGWSGAASSTINPLEFTIDQTKYIDATFEQISQGFIDDGIFLDVDYNINFRKFGNGPVKVVLGDVFGYWNSDHEWTFTDDSHGGRVMETFNYYSDNQNVTLFTFSGNSNDSFNAINTNETVIISASSHDGHPFEVTDIEYTAVERLKSINALYLSSLENPGVDGSLEGGIYTYPHPGNVYVIENDTNALNKTIFVAYYHQELNGSVQGGVDMHGRFVENNLDNTIFVEMTNHYESTGNEISTSHATPKLAAFTAKVLNNHPEFTAEELKNKIMEYTIPTKITVRDLKGEDAVEGENYDFVQSGIGYTYYNTTLIVNLLSDNVMENY